MLATCLFVQAFATPIINPLSFFDSLIKKRSAQSNYGQAAPAPSNYGVSDCQTVNEQQCTTVNEQQCNTVNRQQCSTVNEQQCSTVQEQQCTTVQEQVCNTVQKQECNTVTDTVNEQQCNTINEQVCNTVNEQVNFHQFLILAQEHAANHIHVCEFCQILEYFTNFQKCETRYETVYEEQCQTVNEQQCTTVNEQQCSTVQARLPTDIPRILDLLDALFPLECIVERAHLTRQSKSKYV